MSKRPELVIGFVGPAGVRLRDLIDQTGKYLKEFKYNPVEIRLSRLLERYTGWTQPLSNSEDARILHGQTMGHEFRESVGGAAALTLAAVVAIREQRMELSGDPDVPADAVAYLLNQLKHPTEVKLLRQIYAASFILIAAHATKATRQGNLARRIADSENRTIQEDDPQKAANIIRIDDEQSAQFGTDDLGQNTRNTYPLADLFIDLESTTGEYKVDRFIDLMFAHPFHTPQPDEVAMYHASAAALRSSDESRQVGAVIVNVKRDSSMKATNVDVIATGMNEVPMRGGGFYWDGAANSPDARDQWLIAYNASDDRALTIKKDVLGELLEIFKQKKWFADTIEATQTPALLKQLIPDGLKGTQFLNIGEFQRQVHAEMAAIIDSARRGVAVDGQTMYVTTFPCHNCAKHIIAAGLRQVVYLEPYPKSRAEKLHKEEVELESKLGAPHDNNTQSLQSDSKVVFSPYSGVAPRQYLRLFSMSGRGKKNNYSLKDWGGNKVTLSPQYLVRNAFASYRLAEREELARLPVAKFKWDPNIVCP